MYSYIRSRFVIGLASKNNPTDHFPTSCGTMMHRHTGMHAGVYVKSSCASLERAGNRHTMEMKLAMNYIGPEASPEQILSDRK